MMSYVLIIKNLSLHSGEQPLAANHIIFPLIHFLLWSIIKPFKYIFSYWGLSQNPVVALRLTQSKSKGKPNNIYSEMFFLLAR